MSNVSIRGLSKRFGGKTPTTAIDNLDLEIEPGEFLVLLGPSGCGKTTTLRCIAGLETAEKGSIAFGDRTVFDAAQAHQRPAEQAQHRHGVPVVRAVAAHDGAQEHRLPAARRGRSRARRRRSGSRRSRALVDTTQLLDRYPAQLSGGQQQRVALARGLVARPELVLFDEPLSNLDARLRDQRADGDPRAARAARVHRRLRDARPGRGARARRPARDHAHRRARAARRRPSEVFEEPATEYVAELHRHGEPARVRAPRRRWTVDERAGRGRPRRARRRRRRAIVARTRAEDIGLAPPRGRDAAGYARPSRRRSSTPSSAAATSTSSSTVGSTRVLEPDPAGERGGWARTLEAGQPRDGVAQPARRRVLRRVRRVSSSPYGRAAVAHADMATEAIAASGSARPASGIDRVAAARSG